MSIPTKKLKLSEVPISLMDFLKSYNDNIPPNFPQVSVALLQKYKSEHPAFFKQGEFWSLDLHRKKIMDWLPHYTESSADV